jgi:hypothetical protein
VRQKLSEENLQIHETVLSFSLGGATALAGDTLTDIIQSADQAMYLDKASRRKVT